MYIYYWLSGAGLLLMRSPTVVADRFTDGGSNGKQRFEIDGHR